MNAISLLPTWTDADDLDCARFELHHAVRFWRRWHTKASRHRVRQALAYLRAHRSLA